MTAEKLIASNNPVLRTIGNLFSTDMISGKSMPVSVFPSPWRAPSRTNSDTTSNSINISQGGTHLPWTGAGGEAFDRRMSDVGWIRSQAWSAWFIETVYTHTLAPYHKSYKAFAEACSGSCLEMYRKLDISFYFTFTKTPSVGAIAFWQYGTSWMGHAGIVLQLSGTTHFTCIEAHNPTGKEDGFHLKIKTRKLPVLRSTSSFEALLRTQNSSVLLCSASNTEHHTHNPSGLNLIGFITPIMRQPKY
jgi:hypothetical protein